MNGQQTPSTNGHTPHIEPLRVLGLPTQAQPDIVYEMRLLSLWIHEIQQTGRIYDPELVEFLNQVDEVENAPEGALLLQQQCEVLVDNIKLAQNDIRDSCKTIQFNLNELSNLINNPSLTPEKEQELRSQIRENTQQFLHGIEYLLDVTEHHVYKSIPFWKKWIKRTDESESENVRKWMNDLNYIREYIARQAQFGVLAWEFKPENLETHDLQRLHKYLENAASTGDLLGNCVQLALNKKVAGADKFALPKKYQSSK
jgi:hypothetical protein